MERLPVFLQVFASKHSLIAAPYGFNPAKNWQNQRFGAANRKSLLDLNIA
jgi:hypothetical protein